MNSDQTSNPQNDNQIPEVEEMLDHEVDQDDIFDDIEWKSCKPLITIEQLEKLIEAREKDLNYLKEDVKLSDIDKKYHERLVRYRIFQARSDLEYLKVSSFLVLLF